MLKFHPASLSKFGSAGVLLASMVACMTLGGCSILMDMASKDLEVIETSSDELLVRLSGDKSVYRPGEAMVLTVEVVNTTDEPIKMRGLNRGSVSFWFGPRQFRGRVTREPVCSRREMKEIENTGGEVLELRPGETKKRQFLLTLFTTEAGDYKCQVQMDPFTKLQDEKRIGKLYSNLIEYRVYGEMLFGRDRKGLVERDEAVGLAAAETPGEIMLTDALMIEDAYGFYEWWINIDYRDSKGARDRAGYLIDPYRGRILSRTQPFDESMKPVRATVSGPGQRHKKEMEARRQNRPVPKALKSP